MKKLLLVIVFLLFFGLGVNAQDFGSLSLERPQAAASQQDRLLVILANFKDTEAPTKTRQEARDIVFGTGSSVANYYQEVSYGQVNITGSVFPSDSYTSDWYTMDLNYTCDLNVISSAAMAALVSGEGSTAVDFLSFEHLVIVVPYGTCGSGLGNVGLTSVMTPVGAHTMTLAWVNANTLYSLYGIGHELGHGFGVWHSGMLKCGNVPFVANGCSVLAVQDLMDIMSFPRSKPGHFTAPHKDKIGWFNNQHQMLEITSNNINSDGIYTLTPYESQAPGIKAIKIPRSASGKAWYLEFRQPIGFDSTLVSKADIEGGIADPFSGVLIHTNDPGAYTDSLLIDLSPQDFSWVSTILKTDTIYSPTGEAGFYDPVDKIKIQIASISLESAKPENSTVSVKISFDKKTIPPINPPVIPPTNTTTPPVNPPITPPTEPIESPVNPLVVVDKNLTQRLKGRILLQVQSHGEAWYVKPSDGKRIYIKNGEIAYSLMRNLGQGITNADLVKIPVGLSNKFNCTDSDHDSLCDKLEDGLGTDKYKADTDGDGFDDGMEVKSAHDPLSKEKLKYDQRLSSRLKGQILLQVQSRGEAWYINPADGYRYYMSDGNAAYEIMRYLSLGISDVDLNKIVSN